MKIIIYTTPECPHCHQAKGYFSRKKIPFQEIDVSSDAKKAEEMIEISGQTGVPVIKIDEKMFIGFDQEEIDKVLQT